jgi:acyl-CoA synthetase (NDP forming)
MRTAEITAPAALHTILFAAHFSDAGKNIPTVATKAVRSTEEAVETARAIGFPVVLKVHSRKITHKTDGGGVKLDLVTPEAMRKAYGEIAASMMSRAGADGFEGVTVQPMEAGRVRADPGELRGFAIWPGDLIRFRARF